ncbi:hypothetical protein chiPu_0027954 [Chiloscyllium punctatum]|uniref:Uncharacterized protein n=1 Tax=Chiloscyllium punctatum TaxID=137246 RepID=A0A401TMK5_CHIPU|nr:hypothetical protein [Chiloscyllium punctatum]
MGGDTERELGFADLGEVGVGEVFLAEMQMLGTGDNSRAPVVVDHELCGRALRHGQRVGDDLQRRGIVEVLGAQLDGADAELGQSLDPVDAVDDGIERIRIRHARTGSQRQGWRGRRSRGLPSARLHRRCGRPRRRGGRHWPSQPGRRPLRRRC